MIEQARAPERSGRMIRVTIELISAVTRATTTIGTMFIANDGTGDADHGDYTVAVCRRGSEAPPRELGAVVADNPKATRVGSVKHYPRLAYNVWRLIARSCLAAFPEEVPSKKLPKGTEPVCNDSVMHGLRAFAKSSQLLRPVFEFATVQDVTAALEWLHEGPEVVA